MFRIRDLMIKVVDEGGIAAVDCTECSAWTGWGCDMGTFCQCSNYGCTVCTAGCTASPTCGPASYGIVAPPQVARPSFSGGLSELKAALRQQLAAVEAQEQARDEALRPKTVAEVDALEAKLKGALDELAAIRRELGSGEGS